MQKVQESVLYYHKGDAKSARIISSVFVRLGIRIRRVEPDQVMEKVGCLAGLPGYGPAAEGEKKERNQMLEETAAAGREETPREIPESVLVLRNFTSGRLDYLLQQLRKSGAAPIRLKAVLTPNNADWSFYHLYEELYEEHQRMHQAGEEAGRKS